MSKKKPKKNREKQERKTRSERKTSYKNAQPKKSTTTVEGTVDHVHPRFAYIITGIENQKDIYVKTHDLHTAMHGDRVEIEVLRSRNGENPEGRVKKILKRARTRFVGRVEITKNYAFVVPDFKKIYQDFFIYTENINGAQTNDKVVIEVTQWSEDDKNPEAKVVEILGKTGENEAEIHSIMAEFELPFRFPERVIAESQKISEGITEEEIKKIKEPKKELQFIAKGVLVL